MKKLFLLFIRMGKPKDKPSSRFAFNSGDAKNALIYPGSIIYVPRSSNLASNLEVASIWAPIVSSAALSLTSLSVLKNQ